jgi:hypothetical protein
VNKEPKGQNVSLPLFQAHESRRALYVIKYFVPLGKLISKWRNADYLWDTDSKKQKHLENIKRKVFQHSLMVRTKNVEHLLLCGWGFSWMG